MTKPFVLGLTGSIGMGKSTIGRFFREAGVPVWEADETVHRLYAKGGPAARKIAAFRPQAVKDGAVDREALKEWIGKDQSALRAIEAIIHPLVASDRADFIAGAEAAGERLVVLEIPLLYETHVEGEMDAVLVVSAPADIQKARVMARPGMTEANFAMLLAKQMPDRKKRELADFVIQSIDLDASKQAVMALIERLRTRLPVA